MTTPTAEFVTPEWPTLAQRIDAAYANGIADAIIHEAARRGITLTKPPLRFYADGDDLWTDTPLVSQPEPFGFDRTYRFRATGNLNDGGAIVYNDVPLSWLITSNGLRAFVGVQTASGEDDPPTLENRYAPTGKVFRIRRTSGSSSASGDRFTQVRRIFPKPTIQGNQAHVASICVEYSVPFNALGIPITFTVSQVNAGGTLTDRGEVTVTTTTAFDCVLLEGLAVALNAQELALTIRVGSNASNGGSVELVLFSVQLTWGPRIDEPLRQRVTLDAAGQVGRLLQSAAEIALPAHETRRGIARYDGRPGFTAADYAGRYSTGGYYTTALPFYPDSHEAWYWIVEKLRDTRTTEGGDTGTDVEEEPRDTITLGTRSAWTRTDKLQSLTATTRPSQDASGGASIPSGRMQAAVALNLIPGADPSSSDPHNVYFWQPTAAYDTDAEWGAKDGEHIWLRGEALGDSLGVTPGVRLEGSDFFIGLGFATHVGGRAGNRYPTSNWRVRLVDSGGTTHVITVDDKQEQRIDDIFGFDPPVVDKIILACSGFTGDPSGATLHLWWD